MKRNLLIISLLALSGASLVAVDVVPVRTVLNSKGQAFMVGPKVEALRVKTSKLPVPTNEAAQAPVDSGNAECGNTLENWYAAKELLTTNKKVTQAPEPSVATGWFGKAKGWFATACDSIKEKATCAGEHLSEAYAGAKAKVASVKGTAQEQLADSYTSGKETVVKAREFAQAGFSNACEYGKTTATTAKDTAQAEFTSACEYGQENKSTTAAVVAAGFTTGVALKYLWDKASTGARVAGTIGLSFAGVMLSDNAQAQTFAQENSAPIAIAAVAATVGVLSRTAYSYFSREKKNKDIVTVGVKVLNFSDDKTNDRRTPYSLYWTDKGSRFSQEDSAKVNQAKKTGASLAGSVKVMLSDPTPIIVQL